MTNNSICLITKEVSMLRKAVLAYSFFFACIPTARLISQGADVTLLLNDARRVKGELLSVRDSSILLSVEEGLSDSALARRTSGVAVVRDQEILTVEVSGKSNILKGAGIGLLAGTVSGGLIGFASGDDQSGFIRFSAGDKALTGGVLLGGVGLVIGTVAGIASSTRDRNMDPLPGADFSTLKSQARYKTQEPWFLKNIR